MWYNKTMHIGINIGPFSVGGSVTGKASPPIPLLAWPLIAQVLVSIVWLGTAAVCWHSVLTGDWPASITPAQIRNNWIAALSTPVLFPLFTWASWRWFWSRF